MSNLTALENRIKRIPRDLLKYNLKSWGVAKSDLDNLAKRSFTKGRMDNNIVDLKMEDVMNILIEIYC